MFYDINLKYVTYKYTYILILMNHKDIYTCPA